MRRQYKIVGPNDAHVANVYATRIEDVGTYTAMFNGDEFVGNVWRPYVVALCSFEETAIDPQEVTA